MYYITPSQLALHPSKTQLRLGGQVVPGSVKRLDQHCTFTVSDGAHSVVVHYSGSVPTLFREGQGVVAQGDWHAPIFQAYQLLVKHDEYYRPPGTTPAS